MVNTMQFLTSGKKISQEVSQSFLRRLWVCPWFQIYLISFICFCCPGMYNALGGLGGSGQLDPTVAANATVALLSATAAAAIFVAGPLIDLFGPRVGLLVGGWTYALYGGSLLNFNHHPGDAAFVITAGAILGIGAAFLWVSQGTIMSSYAAESHKGRAIAIFWIIFNLGGGIGSLASFGLNFHSTSGTVSDSTYIVLMALMLLGWGLGVFICPPGKIARSFELTQERKVDQIGGREAEKIRTWSIFDKERWKSMVLLWCKTITDWRVAFLYPVFFCANIFYSYQQNDVNGMTFNIRTRSLNGALYWIAQMFGGLVMGYILDFPGFDRRQRAQIGWALLLCSGMLIWGGGYAFQRWLDDRMISGKRQDIDFRDGRRYIGPMFLYIFYGMYDAFWQAFSYWMIGAKSNSASVTSILVGAYKSFQSVGGAMAWRINALHERPMAQLAMNWGVSIGSLIISIPAVWAVTLTNEGTGTHTNEGEEKVPQDEGCSHQVKSDSDGIPI